MASLRHDGERQREGYDTAQICRNGHMITASAEDFPQHRQAHCSGCGQATLMNCEHCGEPIRGSLRGVFSVHEIPVPRFCHACGEAFPWTRDALVAAKEAADLLDGLNDADREALKLDLEDLVRETPRTPVAALRFRRVVAKAGSEAPGLFKDLLVGVVSTAVLKQIGLG